MGTVQETEHPDFTLLLKNLVNRNEWERRESDLSSTLNPTIASEIGKRLQRPDSFDHRVCYPSRGVRTAFCNVVADPFKVVCGVRRPARASASIALVHASNDIVVLEQSAFTRGSPTLFNLAAEPLVVIH